MWIGLSPDTNLFNKDSIVISNWIPNRFVSCNLFVMILFALLQKEKYKQGSDKVVE